MLWVSLVDVGPLLAHDTHRRKVLTLVTLFIINNLSAYTKPYIFCKGFTSLAVNDLSVYISENFDFQPQKTHNQL